MKVLHGSVKVNSYAIIKRSKDLIAIEIDLATKYCELACTTSSSGCIPGVILDRTKHTLYFDPKKRNISTEIEFEEFKGWTVWSSNASRYSVRLCLIRL